MQSAMKEVDATANTGSAVHQEDKADVTYPSSKKAKAVDKTETEATPIHWRDRLNKKSTLEANATTKVSENEPTLPERSSKDALADLDEFLSTIDSTAGSTDVRDKEGSVDILDQLSQVVAETPPSISEETASDSALDIDDEI